MTTTPETIAELRRLLAEATPGPVTTQHAPDNDPNYLTLQGGGGYFDGFHGYLLTGFCHPFDQRYIVALLNAAPSLLSDLEAAQKALAEIRELAKNSNKPTYLIEVIASTARHALAATGGK
jgi:hypothetical protein